MRNNNVALLTQRPSVEDAAWHKKLNGLLSPPTDPNEKVKKEKTKVDTVTPLPSPYKISMSQSC